MITREIDVEIKVELTEKEYIDMIRELDPVSLARYTVVLFDELDKEKLDSLYGFFDHKGPYLKWAESARQFAARLESSAENGE